MAGNRIADGALDRALAVGPEDEALARVDDNVDNDYGQRQDNIAGSLHQLLGIDTSRRMDLTENERNLAINIKEAIASFPEVSPVSDFMCAQLALIDGDNTEGAIERVHHLQCFREEYGICDTVEDGKRCCRDFIRLFPELFLCFTYMPEGGHYTMAFDMNKFHSSKIRSDEKLRICLAGSYYIFVSICPDFDAIRSGCIAIYECEGYDWKKNVDLKTFKKIWTELAGVYPCWWKAMKYINATNSMKIVQSMIRPLLPQYLRSRLEIGCQYEERLSSLYMVPTVEAANARFLTNIGEALQRRYENERTFQL